MFRFLPWKFIVQRAARAYGMADPALWLARIRSFAQPSEVAEPIELLRAGVLFHARGIVNTKAIQHNLDWVWPYWVERQFDPEDTSFIPRAFSFSHVNLTHRNWTAIGLPELSIYPIVDPRGLITPIQDGWSIDFWLIDSRGRMLIPSRLHDEAVCQRLQLEGGLTVATTVRQHGLELRTEAAVLAAEGQPAVVVSVEAASASGGELVVAVRPYNPEGVQFIDRIESRPAQDGWRVNDRLEVIADRPADRLLASDYARGDVFGWLVDADGRALDVNEQAATTCKVGMATAAGVFKFGGSRTDLRLRIPLQRELAELGNAGAFDPRVTWQASRACAATLSLPDDRLSFLYDAAVQTLILFSADDIVPGPYTYRRFWFRDACLMMNAMLAIGLIDRCRRAVQRFPDRQMRNGYFRSQEGEWDSNGQVLWILDRLVALSGEPLPGSLMAAVGKAVSWIDRKRVRSDGEPLHAGLLPAGFSAEHLGPNDHYYWDDFWSEAGLRAASRLYQRLGRIGDAAAARAKANDLRLAIDRSIQRIPAWRALGGIPASPHRRIDAGAVGSLVADYPLQLYPPAAPRIMATVEALLRRCFLHGGFFQDMIHSGINAYLTLDIAQTLLRAGDARCQNLVESVARFASPTGQWPEAIHPHSGGGCMGDGQHGWAAAEWVMMIRNLFIREEGDGLIVGSGLFDQWLQPGEELGFGPTPTPWGAATIAIRTSATTAEVTIKLRPTGTTSQAPPPAVRVALPGFRVVDCAPINEPVYVDRLPGGQSRAPLQSPCAYVGEVRS